MDTQLEQAEFEEEKGTQNRRYRRRRDAISRSRPQPRSTEMRNRIKANDGSPSSPFFEKDEERRDASISKGYSANALFAGCVVLVLGLTFCVVFFEIGRRSSHEATTPSSSSIGLSTSHTFNSHSLPPHGLDSQESRTATRIDHLDHRQRRDPEGQESERPSQQQLRSEDRSGESLSHRSHFSHDSSLRSERGSLDGGDLHPIQIDEGISF